MKNIKKITAVMLCAIITSGLMTGCGNSNKSKVKEGAILNFTAPEKNEEVAVVKVKDYGDIKIKLFPELCPKGVENFVGLAEKGYYDNLIFHRTIQDFMIQGGDPLGTGTGGESLWGGQFDGGVTDGLYHFVGAVAYANSGSTATDGSQFYIVTGADVTEMMEQYADAYAKADKPMSKELQNKYIELGGAIHLDGLAGDYTIFGQVYAGLDTTESISKVKTDSNNKPETDVVIEKISIEKYDGEDVKFYLKDYE